MALLDGPSVAEAGAREVRPKKWRKGKGWGWVWGPRDEIGALNELSAELARKALARLGRRPSAAWQSSAVFEATAAPVPKPAAGSSQARDR